MSKLGSTRSTGKSFGYPSEKEINVWSSEGKRKASLFASRQNRTLNLNSTKTSRLSIQNGQEMQYAFNSSLNQLRDKSKTEKSNSSTLSNRMSYLDVELRRKKQIMEVAKNKYHRMVEVRQRSFVEKKQLTMERERFTRRHHQSVTLNASRIREERKNGAISTQIYKEKNQGDYLRIKNQQSINEKLVADRKTGEVERKRVMVLTGHKNTDCSREKMRTLEQRKVSAGKNTHDIKLLQEYMKGEMQKRKNNSLLSSFRSKVQRVEDEATRVGKELKEYERGLGWHYSSKTGRKASSSGSFYMTH